MLLHRICAASHGATVEAAFGGQGGLHGSGRWHFRGRRIVYTASHRSLAMLEILVHLDSRWSLRPMVAWEIDVPDSVIGKALGLPADWRSNPEATRAYGEDWLASGRSAALCVPSAVVPVEFNVLLNPAHPGFDLTWVRQGPLPAEIDPRLL